MSAEPQPLYPVPPVQGEDRLAASHAAVSRTHDPLKIMGIVAAFVLVLGGGVGIGIESQAGHINKANQATAAAQSATAAVQGKLTTSELSKANLETQVSSQQTQLDACSTAASLGVQMDAIQHKLVTNALSFGSVAAFDSLTRQYQSIGVRWVGAANTCDPSGGFTFG